MSKSDIGDHKTLRKGSYGILGPVFILFSAYASYMLYREEIGLIVWLVPFFFLIVGFWYIFSNSSYILYREEEDLFWVDHQGKKVTSGNVYIPDLDRMEVYKMRPANSRVARKLQLELILKSGKRLSPPRSLGFGGPANPRYDDLVEELQVINPDIDVKVIDVEGWRKTYH